MSDNQHITAASAEEPKSSTIERVRYLIKQQGLTQLRFSRLIGYDPTNVSKILTGRLPITQAFLNSMVANMGVSKQWLSEGKGLPFSKTETPQVVDAKDEIKLTRRAEGTPVYDIDVTAGRTELSEMFTEDHILGYVSLPQIDPGSSIVRVSGDSMVPVIKDGGMVSIKPITDRNMIYWGQMYVVVLTDYRMVKFVRRHPDPDYVILHSANPAYDDMEVRRSDIHHLYLVDVVLNYEVRC